ncbi:DUF4328 domain-containing protein [Gordonia sp. NPDC003425]
MPDRGPRRIPRYVYIPRWGLRDVPLVHDERPDAVTAAAARLRSALMIASATLAASALMHLFRYVLLVINRDTPLPAWLIAVSAVLVFLAGIAALGGVVLGFWTFTTWVAAVRADRYRSADRTDPRPAWQRILLSAVPLVNVVGGGLLLHEAAAAGAGPWRDTGVDGLLRERLNRLWLAWALVNVVALWAAITWAVSLRSDSIQTGADALALVTLSAAVSAGFAFWASRRLPVLFDAESAAVPDTRWVVVG